MAVHMKYPFKRFSTLARVAGANYRVLARLDHHRSAHYGRLWAMWTKMEMPFNLWIGRGSEQQSERSQAQPLHQSGVEQHCPSPSEAVPLA